MQSPCYMNISQQNIKTKYDDVWLLSVYRISEQSDGLRRAMVLASLKLCLYISRFAQGLWNHSQLLTITNFQEIYFFSMCKLHFFKNNTSLFNISIEYLSQNESKTY